MIDRLNRLPNWQKVLISVGVVSVPSAVFVVLTASAQPTPAAPGVAAHDTGLPTVAPLPEPPPKVERFEKYVGFEFRTRMKPEQMLAALDAAGPWKWHLRDSHWYGDYLTTLAVPDRAVLKILPFPDGGWGLDVKYQSVRPNAQTEWAWLDETIKTKVLPAIGAEGVRPTGPFD